MITKQTIMLLDLINAGKTCNEICEELNITNKQLYIKLTNLKNKGFFLERKYFSNGDIVYKPVTSISSLKKLKKDDYKRINLSENEEIIKVLVLSDIHFGNKLERLDLVDRAFNYAVKEGIHIMFCCGDLIDGTFSRCEKTISDVYSQIDYFIKKYPFDKSILTFGVGGDHDFSALQKTGQDFIEIINNYRHDVMVSCYNNSSIDIKNDKIILHHHISGGMVYNGGTILLKGHKHLYRTYINDDNSKLYVFVPSLSDINESLPTVLDMTFEFKNSKISEVLVKQVYFGDKDYILSEMNYSLSANKYKEKEEKLLEEEKNITMEEMVLDAINDYKEQEPSDDVKESDSKPLTLTRRSKETLNQIEKFNKRYKL